jgi:tRNA nucleotidyltransferase (CCA-adding enzyme)
MDIELPLMVRKILAKVAESGHEIFIVGGITRDLIMNRAGNDWDFTTDAPPEIINALFENSFYDNRFGTVGIIDPTDETKDLLGKPKVYEITTYRKEWGYSDQRHPDQVEWGKTVEEDLIRRDFTINAIAFKPVPAIQKTNVKTWHFDVIDPHCGQKDINNKIIRAVGNPEERFKEDALRMLRAIRLATQLEFKIDEVTFGAIKNNVNLIEKVSWERIRDELLKMLSFPFAAEGYQLLRNSGLAQKILPEVERGFGIEQKSPGRHHIYDVGEHSVYSLKYCPSSDPIVRLAALIHDIGKPLVFKKEENGQITFYNHETVGAALAKNLANRLRLSGKDRDRLYLLVRWHQFSVDERQTDKAIRRFIRNVGKENLEDILDVRTADRLGGGAQETSWRLERYKDKLIEVQKQPFTVADLKIDGHDVMEISGLKSGPQVGEVLKELFGEVEEDMNKNKRQFLLKRLKEIAGK